MQRSARIRPGPALAFEGGTGIVHEAQAGARRVSPRELDDTKAPARRAPRYGLSSACINC